MTKNGTRNCALKIKSLKVSQIAKQSLKILCLSKYLSESFEALIANIIGVLDSFSAFHKMKHNSAIAYQNQLEFLEYKVKDDSS